MRLVEEHGYRTITLETDCLAGLLVDAYVTSGTGTLDAALEHGFSHGWGASAANRDLVRWMRAYNARAEEEGLLAADRLRFAGFDGPLEITHAASPGPASPPSTPTSRPTWTPRCCPAPPRSWTPSSARTTGGPNRPP